MYALKGHRDPYALILGLELFELAQLRHPIVDLLGVRYAIVGPSTSEPPSPWTLVSAGRVPPPVTIRGQGPQNLPYRVYENPTFLPRAYVVGHVRTAPTAAEQLQMLATLAPRRDVLLSQDVLHPGRRASFLPATIVDCRPDEVDVKVTLGQPGYLVLKNTWDPGSEAEDNGQRTVVLPANCVARAVPLAPGSHRVVFRYQPPGLGLGAWISATTLILLIVRIAFTLASGAAERQRG